MALTLLVYTASLGGHLRRVSQFSSRCQRSRSSGARHEGVFALLARLPSDYGDQLAELPAIRQNAPTPAPAEAAPRRHLKEQDSTRLADIPANRCEGKFFLPLFSYRCTRRPPAATLSDGARRVVLAFRRDRTPYGSSCFSKKDRT